MSSARQEIRNAIAAFGQKTENNGLMLGLTGLAFFDAIDKAGRNEERLAATIERLGNSLERFGGYNLSSGLSGFWLLLQYLKKNNRLDPECGLYLEQLKSICAHGLEKYRDADNHDYLHGYLGIYSVQCYGGSKPDVDPDFLTGLISRSVKMAQSECIHEPADKRLNSLLNFGLAHGIPSFLSVLVNRYYAYNDANDLILIREAIDFILSRRAVTTLPSRYPSALGGDLSDKKSRLAWCYGDLGVNLVLLKAAKALNDSALEATIWEDLIYTSSRMSYAETGVKDCSFCHGAGGLVFYFRYLYQESKVAEFKKADEYWTGLIMARYRQYGIEGLKTHYAKQGWQLEFGILEGLIGIYIALFDQEIDRDIINYIFLTNLN